MIDIGQTPAGNAALNKLLREAHRVHIDVSVMTMQGDYKYNLSSAVMDGQVTFDTTTDITRSLSLTLFDPTGVIKLDPMDPSQTSVFVTDMIKIVYVVIDPTTHAVYNVPLFKGPITEVQRDDIQLEVTAQGKEVLSLNNAFLGRTFKRGQLKTDVIHEILSDMCGEASFDIPDRTARLPNNLKLGRNKIPWKVAKRLAHSMSCQLFYDGRGVCRMRPLPGDVNKPVLVMDDSWFSGQRPQITFDGTVIKNAIIVKGAKPKKAKTNVTATAVAPRDDPLSPWALGRNGVPRYIFEVHQDETLRTTAECQTLADSLLNHSLRAGVLASWDGLPHPRLEEMDLVHVESEELSVEVGLNQFVIPLTASVATYGYVKKIRPRGGVPLMKIMKRRRVS
jgi:hypothetical protein